MASSEGKMGLSLMEEIPWNAFQRVKPSFPQSWTVGFKNFSPNHLPVYFNFDRNPKRTSLKKIIIMVSNRDNLKVLKLTDVLTGLESPP